MATLSSGNSLQPGQSLQSDDDLYTLSMQPDGNVVLLQQRVSGAVGDEHGRRTDRPA